MGGGGEVLHLVCPVTKDDIAPYLRERLEVGFERGVGFRLLGGSGGSAVCVSGD